MARTGVAPMPALRRVTGPSPGRSVKAAARRTRLEDVADPDLGVDIGSGHAVDFPRSARPTAYNCATERAHRVLAAVAVQQTAQAGQPPAGAHRLAGAAARSRCRARVSSLIHAIDETRPRPRAGRPERARGYPSLRRR